MYFTRTNRELKSGIGTKTKYWFLFIPCTCLSKNLWCAGYCSSLAISQEGGVIERALQFKVQQLYVATSSQNLQILHVFISLPDWFFLQTHLGAFSSFGAVWSQERGGACAFSDGQLWAGLRPSHVAPQRLFPASCKITLRESVNSNFVFDGFDKLLVNTHQKVLQIKYLLEVGDL